MPREPDFLYTPDTERLLAFAEFVKLDLLALGHDGLAKIVTRLAPTGVTLVAEKLETPEDYAFCAHAGCHLFQGYFFCRPQLMRGRRIDANRAALLDLLAALHDPTTELADLQRKIVLDVRLSFRLLRYINSAFFGLRQQVRSIRQAVALLGLEHLRQWATLTVFTSIDDKPAELTTTALVRARFCELAAHDDPDATGNELFTLGLFSVIDALLDTRMTELLAKLPLATDVCEALADHKGPKGQLLECLHALESGDLASAKTTVPTAGQLYISALAWADETIQRLSAH
ncbi:MAG: EAL and HDOD domain-containing protein [Solirubrobacteraceae bacterium]